MISTTYYVKFQASVVYVGTSVTSPSGQQRPLLGARGIVATFRRLVKTCAEPSRVQEDEDNFTDQQPTTTEYSQVLKLRRHPATHSGQEPGESGDHPDHTPLVLYLTTILISF